MRRKGPSLFPFPSLLQLQAWLCPAEPEPPDLTRQEPMRGLTPTVGMIQDDPWCPGAPACMRLLKALGSHWDEQVWTTTCPPTSQPGHSRSPVPRRSSHQSELRVTLLFQCQVLFSERREGALCNRWKRNRT